jgi:hypothetical protein
MSTEKGYIELSINKLAVNKRNGNIEPTGERITGFFNNGGALANFYNKQKYRNIDNEFEQMKKREERGQLYF